MTGTNSDPGLSREKKPDQVGFWLRELPYIAVLVATMAGVAYTSYLQRPIPIYWEVLAPLVGVICIAAGWSSTSNRQERWQLIWMQVLHWLAFLLVINLLYVPSVQRILNGGATALAILSLMALGTFTAGVQVRSWQVCALGIVMALGVPTNAWIQSSSLIVVLLLMAAIGVGAMLWRFLRERSRGL